MASAEKDQLFRLIQSLTKAEKRSFRLYAGRTGGNSPSKFVQLFDALDKLETYDEPQLLKRLEGEGISKGQLPNLKRHLYQELMTSLRLIHTQKEIDLQIREQLDFARILYGKGLYMDGLRLLERCKQLANKHNQDILHLEILEFQKLIEARHITRSRQIDNKMEQLLTDSQLRSRITLQMSELFNLNIQIHGYYIERGHARTEAERHHATAFWTQHYRNLSQKKEKPTFFERINQFQAHMWYHYILLELKQAAHFARKWTNCFDQTPGMQDKDPDLYMRGMYYVLTFAFLLADRPTFTTGLANFERFLETHSDTFNRNSEQIAFVYYNLSRLNDALLRSDYEQAQRVATSIQQQLPHYRYRVDVHRLMLLEYKFAYIQYMRGDFDGALDYLNTILNQKSTFLRDDIHINARILAIYCHYQLEHYALLDSLLTSAQRLLHRSTDSSTIQRLSVQLIHQLVRTPKSDRLSVLRKAFQQVTELEQNPYEWKSMVYFNLRQFLDRQFAEAGEQPVVVREGQLPAKG